MLLARVTRALEAVWEDDERVVKKMPWLAVEWRAWE